MPYAIVTLNQTMQDKTMANVLAFDNVQEDSAWLTGFADAIRDLANDSWDNHCSTAWSLDNITVSFVDDAVITYSVTVDFTDGNLQGNGLVDALPRANACLIRTGFVGPAPNRGRIYFGGFTESKWDGSGWESDLRADLRTMVEAWRDGIQVLGNTASLQIARRPSDKFPAYVFNPVQTVGTSLGAASQRNRNY